MSREIDDLDLITLRELGKSSQKVQDLIQEKNNILIDLEQKAVVRSKKLDPAPSPSNDKRLLKTHSERVLTQEELQERQQRVEKEFNGQIREAMIEKAIETDQDYYIPTLQNMEAREVAILNEKGLNAYKQHQQKKQHELENDLTLDLDDDTRFNSMLQSYRFSDNAKDLELDNKPDPANDFE